jgi:hypothetical protein
LTEEARRRNVLVADLIAIPPSTSPPTAPLEPTAPPHWQDVEPIDDGGAYVKRLGARFGLVSPVFGETAKAWRVALPNGELAWLPKLQCACHGADQRGRLILVLLGWPAARIGLMVAP